MIATVMSMDSKILLLLWRYCFLSLRLSKRLNWYFWGILSEASNIFGSGIMLEPSNCTLKKKSSRPQSFTGLSKLKIVCLIRYYVRVASVLKKTYKRKCYLGGTSVSLWLARELEPPWEWKFSPGQYAPKPGELHRAQVFVLGGGWPEEGRGGWGWC